MVKEHVEKINVKGGWEGLIERGRRTYTEVNRANGYKGKGPRHQMLKEAFRVFFLNLSLCFKENHILTSFPLDGFNESWT